MALPSSRRRSTSGSSSSLDDQDDSNTPPSMKEEQKQNSSSLPQDFLVKYLGKKDARGLWGIKHTRKPVDDLVALARGMKTGAQLPFLQLSVSEQGVLVTSHPHNLNQEFEKGLYSIDTISYGVQDLVYTRVFAMIVVKETPDVRIEVNSRTHPFECHAFVCDSRSNAR